MEKYISRFGYGVPDYFPKRKAKTFRPHTFDPKVKVIGGIPKIFITHLVYSKMWHYVDLAEKEVGWLGTVAKFGGNYLIEDVYLFKQEVGYTTTEITTDGLADFASDILTNQPDGMEIVNRLQFWGHSHVNMGTSPSSQDESQMSTFASSGHPWFIRGILNKLGRIEFSIYLYATGLIIDDVEWAIYEPVDESMRSGIKSEFDEKVSEISYASVYTSPSFDELSESKSEVCQKKKKNKIPKRRKK